VRLASEILIDERRIGERVAVMAQAIAADTAEGVPLVVIALLDGSFMFCADLVRRLPMPVRIGLVPLISVGRGGAPERLSFPLGLPLASQDVLVVEDILDSGRTLGALRERLAAERPRRLRFAVLLDKPSGREVDVVPDYVGFTVGDRWVVGYGLDYEGLYRNLPYITYVE
jgi:hypoxanthine phosphoribosyltransferase